MRQKVLLICEECLSRNYSTTINKEKNNLVSLRKYCPHCGKYTNHKISK